MAPQMMPEWFREARGEPCPIGAGAKKEGFLERTLKNIASFASSVFFPVEWEQDGKGLKSIEPKARIGGVFLLVLASSICAKTVFLAGVFLLCAALAVLSGVNVKVFLKRLLPTVAFTFILAIPVFTGYVTPGTEALGTGKASITYEGLSTGLFFLFRVTVMVSLAALLVFTTRQSDFFRGLRELPLPGLFTTALFMTFRYLLVLVKTAEDVMLARKARSIRGTALRESQGWFASRAGLILKKSFNLAEEVNMAMASRGFTGKVRTISGRGMSLRDYLWVGLGAFVFFLSFGL